MMSEETLTKTKTMREAISEALWEEMERDERMFILGEEVGVWGGTYAVTKRLPRPLRREARARHADRRAGVIVGAGIGAAMVGLRPVAEMMTINFAFLAMDAIVNHAAKVRYMFGGQFTVPLVIRTTAAAGGSLAPRTRRRRTRIFAHFPGMYTVVPSTPRRRQGPAQGAIRDDNPVFFIEHSHALPDARRGADRRRLHAAARQVQRQARGHGRHARHLLQDAAGALQAAERLPEDGIERRNGRSALPAPARSGAGLESLQEALTGRWWLRKAGARMVSALK
jgi:pyruvate/2-oxoglutarate/acetoin dehydrogenase E1 component